MKTCPFCAEEIRAAAVVCKHCGRELVPQAAEEVAARIKPPKKWYRRPWFLILTFILLTPLWTLIVLDDPDQSTGVKVLAAILLLVYVVFVCLPLAS